MKYEIKEVLPAQIQVEFEDGSWALVPIKPDSSPEEIDHAVSQYDSDFLADPQTLINPNISVGQQRESKKLEENQSSSSIEAIQQSSETENFVPTEYNDLQLILNTINPINISLSNYFDEQGDSRIKEAIQSKVVEYLDKTNLTVEKIIDDIIINPEDIMMQAEAELNAEQS